MTTLVWIIGQGGLLGSALERKVSQRVNLVLFQNHSTWMWNDDECLRHRMKEAVATFASTLSRHTSWQIYWAAGRGTMSSSPEELATETAQIAYFLEILETTSKLQGIPGTILFASSAGAMYGDAGGVTVSEEAPTNPVTAYGRAKLEQEQLLKKYCETQPNVRILLARFSNIYGPGQSSKKKQGLISHIARSIILHRPISIFVPFDTIRDYIFVDDAAERSVSMLQNIGPGTTVAIIASEDSTTIAHIIGIFRHITKLNPRIIRSTNALGDAYPRRVQFRSTKQSTVSRKTPLHIGVSLTLAHERSMIIRRS